MSVQGAGQCPGNAVTAGAWGAAPHASKTFPTRSLQDEMVSGLNRGKDSKGWVLLEWREWGHQHLVLVRDQGPVVSMQTSRLRGEPCIRGRL